MEHSIMEKLQKEVQTVLTDQIIQKVIRKIAFYEKKAAVLFTGAALGFGQGLDCVKEMQEDGLELSVFLTESASKVLPTDYIAKTLGRESIFSEGDLKMRQAEIINSDILLIPALTVNTAAKIACGFTDTMASAAAATALQKGIRIIACRDGCCPDQQERQTIGFHANANYAAMMRQNLKTIESYGVKLTDTQNFTEVCTKELLSGVFFKEAQNGSSASQETFEKQVMSREDAGRFRENSRIQVKEGIVITALAKEELKTKNVKLTDLAGETICI